MPLKRATKAISPNVTLQYYHWISNYPRVTDMRAILAASAILMAPGLSGCAARMVQAAQSECSAFGFSPGTDAYAVCVQQRYGAHAASIQAAGQRLQAVGAGMKNAQAPAVQGFLRSQRVQGTSRICVYDRVGSPYVITVNAADFCPLNAP